VPEHEEFDLINHSAIIFDSGTASFDAITKAQLGRAVVAALLPANAYATRNQYVFVRSFTLTQTQVLGYLQGATGSDWTIQHRSSTEQSFKGRAAFAEMMKRPEPATEKGFYAAILDIVVAVYFGYGGEARFTEKTTKWMDILQLEEETPEAVVRRVCEMF